MAISCNFTFIESDDIVDQASEEQIINLKNTSNPAFQCEQDFEDDFEFTFSTVSGITGVVNRFSSKESLELQEVSCASSKRFITPKALNNIYNQLTPVLNTASFVQKIQIVQCR